MSTQLGLITAQNNNQTHVELLFEFLFELELELISLVPFDI